jgi:hypothetical protein
MAHKRSRAAKRTIRLDDPDDGLLQSLQRAPEIRPDVVERNRTRVKQHDLPGPDDVADRIVDRIIAERQA